MRVHVASRWRSTIRLASALIFVLWQSGTASTEPAPALKAFVTTHRCALLERLMAVHGGSSPNSTPDRFLILARADQPQAHVLCIFHESNQRLRCEASSGFHYNPAGEPRRFRLRPGESAKLARYKFSSDDSRGNFLRMIELGETFNLAGVASMMLNMLHDIYGADMSTRLMVNQPVLSRGLVPLASTACRPQN
jgi:hypothetical protein